MMKARTAEILALILVAPILAFPPVSRPLLLFVPLLLPMAWIAAARDGELLPITPLNGALLLVLTSVLVSTFASADIGEAAGKVFGIVLGAAVYLVAVRAIHTRRQLDAALEVFAATGAALAAFGVLGANWIGKIAWLDRITRFIPPVVRHIPGLSEGFQPNAVAGTLLLFIPVQLAFTLIERGRRRSAFLAALVFTGAALVLTQSRNAWLSLAVGLLAWALWSTSKLIRRAAVAIIVAGAIVGSITAASRPAATQRFIGTDLSTDMLTRLEIWSRAIAVVEDFPFTGVGMNGFRRVMPVLYPAVLSPPSVDVTHAHNHLLQVAVDIGLPGLVGYLALWFVVTAMLVRSWKASSDRRHRLLVGGLGGGLMAFFAFGTADAIALGAKLGVFFWIAIAAASLVDRCRPEARG